MRIYVIQLVPDAILNPNLNAKQQVLSLIRASISPTARHIFKSAGLIDKKELSTLTYLANQMKVLLKAARMKRSIRGRPIDDQRSLVESVLYACVTTPERVQFNVPSDRSICIQLGMPISTGKRI